MRKTPSATTPRKAAAVAAPASGTSRKTAPVPIPFIQSDPSTKRLTVSAAARAFLSDVSGTVGVATVAGVYRTGKSYILNQLAGIDGSAGGFTTSSSVQACTKGIWLWGAPLPVTSSAPGAGLCQVPRAVSVARR